jgi:lipid A 3-O-deacylase
VILAAFILSLGLNLDAAAQTARVGDKPAEPLPTTTSTTPAPAPESAHTVVSLRWENDVVSGTDENYSNGISLMVARNGRGPVGGLWSVFGLRSGRLISTYELGQLIVTPQDIRRIVPDPADRPYAGLLYVAISTQRVDGNRFDGIKFITGVVGPASLAENVQKSFHRHIGNPIPEGWDYQLKNEAILNMVYEHRRRYTLAEGSSGWRLEAIPVAGAMLGNVLIQAEAETQLRIGYHLPDDFGTTLMRGLGNPPTPRSGREVRGSPRMGVYAFAGGGANLVARNLTLDGNTIRDGPRVSKRPLFPGAEVGMSTWTPWFEAYFAFVFWGREYESQSRASHFGVATIAFRF